jgi:hypothetical protein
MRTTLEIADDVLLAAKQMAKARNTTAGEVLSDLARQALMGVPPKEPPEYRGGFRLLPRTGTIITPDLVKKLMEEDV